MIFQGWYYDFIHEERGNIAIRGVALPFDCTLLSAEDRGHWRLQCGRVPEASSYVLYCYDALGRRFGYWTGTCRDSVAEIDIDLSRMRLPTGWLYFTLSMGQTTESFRIYNP